MIARQPRDAALVLRGLAEDESKALRQVNDLAMLAHVTLGGGFLLRVGAVLGISGNGDIVIAHDSYGNSNPVSFLDPVTFREKSRFGASSISVRNSAIGIVRGLKAIPAAYIEVETDLLTGETDVTPKRCTVIASGTS